MRVVLVYRGRYLVRQALDLETLAAALREKGHEAALAYDPDVFGVTDNVLRHPGLARLLSAPEHLAAQAAAFQPGLVFLSMLPATREFLIRTASILKQTLDAPIIAGGLFPALCPEAAMECPAFSGLVLGEAEETLPALLSALKHGKAPGDVPGVWWRTEGKVLKNPPAPPLDLARLPLPDKDLFAPWIDHRESYPAMVSRGCPFSCSYCEETCMSLVLGKEYFRRMPVERVMAELRAAKARYGFREVIFKDSYLSGSHVWLAALMDAYKREIKTPFKCFCTIAGFTERTARLLKEGGCYSIEFGLQTWNENLRRTVLGRMEKNADARRVFSLCARHRIWHDVDHMFNLPGEREEDHALGAREYKRLARLGRVKVHYLVYLPGAPIVEKAKEAGALGEEAARALEQGGESDFYDQGHGSPEAARTVAGYAALYKVLPLVPVRAVEWLVKKGRVRGLAGVPEPVMAALQGIVAVRARDLRFRVVLREYPRKIGLAVWRRARAGGALK
jgi:radical SAM superfamily enzyme YgiQ (UPF0313 family)